MRLSRKVIELSNVINYCLLSIPNSLKYILTYDCISIIRNTAQHMLEKSTPEHKRLAELIICARLYNIISSVAIYTIQILLYSIKIENIYISFSVYDYIGVCTAK